MIKRCLKIAAKILIAMLLLATASSDLFAQGGRGTLRDVYNPNKNNGNDMGMVVDPNAPVDSLGGKRERKPRKPLESYYFVDSIKKRNVFSWQHNPYNNNISIVPIDTMLTSFQKDYLFYRNAPTGVAYMGNLGAASMPLNYAERKNFKNFSFLDGYADYIMTPEDVRFYNGRKPFSQLSFFMSGQTKRAEEQLRVLHSQNISPSTAIALDYRNNGTRGMYNNQRSKDKNLSLSLVHTGKKYSFHGGYIYNMGDLQENGGLVKDAQVKDTLIDLPQNIEMNLKDAKNKFKGNTFYFTHSYAFPFKKVSDTNISVADVSTIFIGNSFDYTKYRKTYTDTKAQTSESFYKKWYMNPTMSADSLSEQNMNIRFFAQLQPYNRNGVIGTVDGGIGYNYENYYNFVPSNYITGNHEGTSESSVYVYANAGGRFKEYLSWQGHFKYTPIGYRSQDLNAGGTLTLGAKIRRRPVNLSFNVDYSLQEPSYWSQNYFSNHYVWSNSFKKEGEIRLGATFSIPSSGIEVGASQVITNNKVYYDFSSLPVQYSDALSVTGLYLRKDFRIAGLHLNNRVQLQWSSAQDIAPVPLVSANATYFYEFNLVKNVLRLQVGVDGYYNTDFYGPGYNPAIMQFYNQREVKTGNYIWMDAFVSGKWKRLRFLVKLQHFNYELFGGREYFQVAHYPLNRRMLKFGVSWNFYD